MTYLKSPCCGGSVVVPVDVTAHLRVKADGTVSKSVSDTLRGIRLAAVGGEWNVREAYCEHCGCEVSVAKPTQKGA